MSNNVGVLASAGALVVNGAFDKKRVEKLTTSARNSSLYGGGTKMENFMISRGGLLFVVLGAGNTMSNTLLVRDALNGLGQRASELYGSRPNGEEIVQAIIQRQIKFVGVAGNTFIPGPNGTQGNVSVIRRGVVAVDSSQYGDRPARIGDLIQAVVPPPSLTDATRKKLKKGLSSLNSNTPEGKIALAARAYTPKSTGVAVLHKIRELLADPVKFTSALGNDKAVLTPELTACAHLFDFLHGHSIDQLIEWLVNGWFVPTPKVLGVLRLPESFIKDLQETATKSAKYTAAYVIAAAILDVYHVTPLRKTSNQLTGKEKAAVDIVKLNALRRSFHGRDPKSGTINVAHEFGFIPAGGNATLPTFLGRDPNGFSIKSRDQIGEALRHQSVQGVRAVSALAEYVQQERETLVGTAVSSEAGYLNVEVSPIG